MPANGDLEAVGHDLRVARPLQKANLRKRNLGFGLRLNARGKGLIPQTILEPGRSFTTNFRATSDAPHIPVIHSEPEAEPPMLRRPAGVGPRTSSDVQPVPPWK